MLAISSPATVVQQNNPASGQEVTEPLKPNILKIHGDWFRSSIFWCDQVMSLIFNPKFKVNIQHQFLFELQCEGVHGKQFNNVADISEILSGCVAVQAIP